MNESLTAFDQLTILFGQSSAIDMVNEKISEKMLAEHPEYETLDPADKDFLWMDYCDAYGEAAAAEALEESTDA